MNVTHPLLSIHPKPLRGESSTSWLVRVSLANYTDLERMLSDYVGRDEWHRRDIDWLSQPEASKLYIMAGPKTGVPAIQKLLLSRWTESLNISIRRGVRYSHSWITSPTQIRYCPLCLAEDGQPYLRLTWRLIFIPTCPRHEIFLRTGCQNSECDYSHPMRLFQRNAACSKCGVSFADARAIKAKNYKIHKFIKGSMRMLNSNVPPPEFAALGTTAGFLELLLYVVRRMGTYIARNLARDSLLLTDERASHNQKVLDYWRSDERITYFLIGSALELMKEGPQPKLVHLKNKRFSPAHQQVPPRWIRDKAEHVWNEIRGMEI